MRVSIITTIYKAERDLPRLLDSMIRQKNPNLEFFLIDNGSPDRCGAICAEYAKEDPRIVIYTIKENVGYIRARNIGIEHCSGDFVGFCDSDDYLESGGYDRAIEMLEETKSDLYITSWRTHYHDGTKRFDPPFAPGVYDGERIRYHILTSAFGPYDEHGMLHGFAWKQICRRSLIMDNGIRFNESLKPYEDQLFNVDIIQRCNKIYVDNNIIYNYIVSSTSITAQLTSSDEYGYIWERIVNLYKAKKDRAIEHSNIVAAANVSLYAVVSLMSSIVQNRDKTIAQSIDMFKKSIDSSLLLEILYYSNVRCFTKAGLVRLCLRMRMYRVLFFLLRMRTNKRG